MKFTRFGLKLTNVDRELPIAIRIPHVETWKVLLYVIVTTVILEMVQSVKINFFV